MSRETTTLIRTAALIATSLTAVASAQTASFTINSASSAGDLGSAGNTTATGTFTSSFVAQSLTWSGDITSTPNFFFFEQDVYASVSGPNGIGYTGAVAGEQGIFLGTTPFSGWNSGFTPASVNGDWSFEAYTETGGTEWTMLDTEFSFNAALFPAAEPIAIGTDLDAPITEGEILWYSIEHSGGAIEFSTAGSQLAELEGNIMPNDTIVALYDSTGALVGSDTDGDIGFTSLLSFADLASGEYHLAVTGYTLGTRVGDNFIATSHDAEGTISLSVTVPTPGTMLLFAGITATAIRRRR